MREFTMRLSESRIRLIIRDELQENLQGFLGRTRGIEYSASEDDDPTFEVDPESRDLARAVKRAWAAEADHRFMDSVTKIHWINAATDDNIQKLLSSSGRDEISTMGYISGPYNSGLGGWPVWGKIGFVIQGRTTLASNSMDDLYSGYHKNIPSEVREKYKSSGIRKRATGFNPWKADSYILDSASFDPAMQGENEFIVSHWKVTGVVLTESESEKLSAALKGGEIPDWQADEWDRIFGLLDKLGVPWLMRKHRNRVRAWLDRRTSSGAGAKVTESRMRSIIRDVIEEDLQGFRRRTAGIGYNSSVSDPTFENDPEARDFARAVKRAWAAEADHDFMRSVTKIHWMQDTMPKNIVRLVNGGRDEISTMGYINGPYMSGPGWPAWGHVGFVVQGRTTLAANSMDVIYSGYHQSLPDSVRDKYRSSGLRKRPSNFSEWNVESYILDAASFDPAAQGENEFIVANWKVTHVIFSDFMVDKLREALETGEFEEWRGPEWDGIIGTIHRLGVPYLKRKQANLAKAWLEFRQGE